MDHSIGFRRKRGAMKTIPALLVAALLIPVSACRKARTAKPEGAPPDKFEALTWHLIRRADELNNDIVKLEVEIAKHDNKCLTEEIEILEGRTRPVNRKRDVEQARQKSIALSNSLLTDVDRMSQGLLDTEDAIKEHNLRHPESPWANVNDMLRMICGDCTRERAIRDSQLKEEAQKHERPDSKSKP
jgi:hypothetical protein